MDTDGAKEHPQEHEREIFARLNRRIRGAMDVLSYATRSLIIDAQSALDEAFKLDE
jgi:hypothetical protein